MLVLVKYRVKQSIDIDNYYKAVDAYFKGSDNKTWSRKNQ